MESVKTEKIEALNSLALNRVEERILNGSVIILHIGVVMKKEL